MLKYQVKLSDYQIKDLSDDSLDPAFVAKAKELEEKITNKSLSDDEIAVIDEELCTLFEELHNFEDVPDEELTELQTQNTILKGKQAATEATTLEELQAVAEEYNQYLDVAEITNAKIAKLKKATEAASEADEAKAKMQKEVAEAKTLPDLEAITAEYNNEDPWIIELVKGRANEIRVAIKAAEDDTAKGLKEKLRTQSMWSYEQLRDIGINPTGEDMVVEGVKLKRKWMFKGYEVA